MQPLQDVRVLAVTVYLAGPYCCMNLARFGAEVIKVEVPGPGDPVRGNGPFAGPGGTHPMPQSNQDLSIPFMKRTQGIKSITLNLKHPEGCRIFLELAKVSDVLVENLAPGSMKRLGLGYQEVSQVNPGIIYCSISGYGQTGPYAHKPAHDQQVQGMSGLMDINGDPDGPPTRVGFYIGDLVAGLFASYSIVAALREKERTGRGEHLDVSIMDSLVTMMFMENLDESIKQGLPMRTGNVTRHGPTGLYHTKDGDVLLTVSSDDQWRRLSLALEAPGLLEDPRFASYYSRITHVEEARQEIQELIGKLGRQEALERLEDADVPCGQVRTAAEVMADPQLWQRGSLQPLRHGAIAKPVDGAAAGFPVVFSNDPLPELTGAPVLGMHNQEVYGELLDLGADKLRWLREQGVA